MTIDFMPPSDMDWKLLTYIRKWERVSFQRQQQPKSHFTSHLLPVGAFARHMCCARRVVEDWRWSGCTGSHRSRAPQPAKGSRERNTNKKSTNWHFAESRYVHREGGCLGAPGTETFRGCFLGVVPLCWLLLSCVESAISVLGRGEGGDLVGREAWLQIHGLEGRVRASERDADVRMFQAVACLPPKTLPDVEGGLRHIFFAQSCHLDCKPAIELHPFQPPSIVESPALAWVGKV